MLGLGLVLFSALVDMFWTRSPMFDRLQRRNNSDCLPKPLPGGKGDTPSTHLPIDVSTSAPSIWFLDYKRPPLRISGSSLIAYKTTTNSRQGPDDVTNPKWSRRHTCCSLPWTSSHLHQKVPNKICTDSVQYRHIQSFQVQSGSGTLCQ